MNKILLVSTLGHVWRTVGRIYIVMFGCKKFLSAALTTWPSYSWSCNIKHKPSPAKSKFVKRRFKRTTKAKKNTLNGLIYNSYNLIETVRPNGNLGMQFSEIYLLFKRHALYNTCMYSCIFVTKKCIFLIVCDAIAILQRSFVCFGAYQPVSGLLPLPYS